MTNPFDIADIRTHIFDFVGPPLPADGTSIVEDGKRIYGSYGGFGWQQTLCFKRLKNGQISSRYVQKQQKCKNCKQLFWATGYPNCKVCYSNWAKKRNACPFLD